MISRVVHLEMFEWPIPIKAAVPSQPLALALSLSLSFSLSLSRYLSFSITHTQDFRRIKYILIRPHYFADNVHTSPGRTYARVF